MSRCIRIAGLAPTPPQSRQRPYTLNQTHRPNACNQENKKPELIVGMFRLLAAIIFKFPVDHILRQAMYVVLDAACAHICSWIGMNLSFNILYFATVAFAVRSLLQIRFLFSLHHFSFSFSLSLFRFIPFRFGI